MNLIEYIPLQQGLRLLNKVSKSSIVSLIEYIPLQQGLRRQRTLYIIKLILLIEYIPLQQGLRLIVIYLSGIPEPH